MFDFRDLFQWERFITPSIIKIFYWLAVGIALLFGLSGIISGLTLMALSPLGGLFYIVGSLIGMVIGVIFARIISEFVLIMCARGHGARNSFQGDRPGTAPLPTLRDYVITSD
jgi:uncharacterized membrane protein